MDSIRKVTDEEETFDTESLCPVCLLKVPAKVFEKDSRMMINAVCPTHGSHLNLHLFYEPKIYADMKSLILPIDGEWMPDSTFMDVTAECNMNCPNCCVRQGNNSDYIPEKIEPPTINQLRKNRSNFSGSLIYLFGGEPTLREDLTVLLNDLKSTGHNPSFFSNGLLLSNPSKINVLKKIAPLVILSLDTLDSKQGKKIYGENVISNKINALDTLVKNQIPVFINSVIWKDINEDQISKLIDLVFSNKGKVRGVSFDCFWDPSGSKNSQDIGCSSASGV